MKTNSWFAFSLIFALGTSAGFSAQAPHHKSSASKPATSKPASSDAPAEGSLAAGPAITVQDHVNVRSRPDTDSEVVTHLKKAEMVTVIEEVTRHKAGPGEPTRWAKVAWPSEVPVWLYAEFVDRSASQVKVTKLNLRAGPGENYSVIGSIEKGTPVKKLDAKGDWWKIEAPEGCHAYIAANLLQSKPDVAPVVVAATKPAPVAAPRPAPSTRPAGAPPTFTLPPPAPAPAPVAALPPPLAVKEIPADGGPVVVPPPTSTPFPTAVRPPRPAPVAVPPSQPLVSVPPPAVPPPAPVKPAAPVPLLTREPGEIDFRPAREETYVKRIVTREGAVRRTMNIQSPTPYVLENLHNGRVMNYLYSTTTNINISAYRGRVVTVSGEEALDERWPNVPVIRVETLQTAP
jgi:SH3-like domain-containing protein